MGEEASSLVNQMCKLNSQHYIKRPKKISLELQLPFSTLNDTVYSLLACYQVLTQQTCSATVIAAALSV